MTTLQLAELEKKLGRRVVIYDARLHESETYDWVADGKPCLLKQLLEACNAIGFVDLGAGRDILFYKGSWHFATYGVFLPDVVFVSDYYGFPSGAIFSRCTTTPQSEQTC